MKRSARRPSASLDEPPAHPRALGTIFNSFVQGYQPVITLGFDVLPWEDPAMGALMDLDGQILALDAKGSRGQVLCTMKRTPHGLNYSLTFHGPQGQRLIGFDNAHSIRRSRGPGGKYSGPADHWDRMDEAAPYRYKDAATLLADFWAEVDRHLNQKGVLLK